GFCQHFALSHETWCFEREDEALRRFVTPLREHLGRLQSIERAVDLDRGDLAARIAQLILLGYLARIERLAPRLVTPATDTRADPSGLSRSHASCSRNACR